jgi:hypothetical protein
MQPVTQPCPLARDGGARLKHGHQPRATLLLNLVAALGSTGAADLVDPGVLRGRYLTAGAVLLSQGEGEGDGVVAELLPAIGEGGACALNRRLALGFEPNGGLMGNRIRSLDLAGYGLAREHDVGDGALLEQLLTGFERLGTGDLDQSVRFDQRKKGFELRHGRSCLCCYGGVHFPDVAS